MEKRINVTRSSMPPFEEYVEEIKPLWENRFLTNFGGKYQELEKKLKKYLNVSNICFFSNGHMALETALNALKLKMGSGEIITTPFTYSSTTQAIVRCGFTPVFCDIESNWYTIDVNKIENLITDKTCAILPVHVYGHVCNYKKIEEIAQRHGLKVIYDAAHAFGVKVNGHGIGEIGDFAMFSFHATKVFHTIEGGALTFKEYEDLKNLKALQMFGMYGKEDAELVGYNAKMTEFQAAMGLCNVRHVDQWIEQRKLAIERYRENLGHIDGIRLSPVQENVTSNYAYLPVYIDALSFGENRDEVTSRLAKHNVFARKYFYPLTSEFSAYENLFDKQKTPIAWEASRNVLTLPLYSDLTVEDVDWICEILLENR